MHHIPTPSPNQIHDPYAPGSPTERTALSLDQSDGVLCPAGLTEEHACNRYVRHAF